MSIVKRSRRVLLVKSLAMISTAALLGTTSVGPIWAATGTPAIQLPESFPLPGPAVAVAADPSGHAVWVAISRPAELVRLSMPSGSMVQTLALPNTPNGGIGLTANQVLVSTQNGLWKGSWNASGPSSVLGWSSLLSLMQQQFGAAPIQTSSSPTLPTLGPGGESTTGTLSTGSGLPGCGTGLSYPVVAGGDVRLSQSLAPASASLPEGGEISTGGALPGSGGGLPPLLNPCGGLTPFWQQELQSLPTTIPPTTMGQLIGDVQGIETALTDQGVPAVDQGQVMIPWLKKVVEPSLFQALGVQSLSQLTSVSPTLWQKNLFNPSASSNLVAGLMLAATAADPSALATNAVFAVDPVTGAHYQIQPGQNILWVSEHSASSSITVPLNPSAQDLTPYFQPMANGQSAMTVGHTTLFVPSSTIPYYQHLSPSELQRLLVAYHQGLSRLGKSGNPFPAPSRLTVAGVVKVVGKHGQTRTVPLVRALPADTVSGVSHLMVTHYGIDAKPFTLYTPQVTSWSPKVLGLATGTGWGYAWGDINAGIISEVGAVFGNQDEEMNGTLDAIYSGQGLAGQSDQVQVTTHVFTWSRSGSVGINASAFPLTIYGAMPPMDNLQSNVLSNIQDTLTFNLPSVTDGTVEGDAEDLGMQLWNYLNKATSYYGDVQALQNVLQVWDNEYGAPQQSSFSSPPFTLTSHDTAQIAVDPSAEIINGGAGTADMATLSLVWVTVREWQVPVPSFQPNLMQINSFGEVPPQNGGAYPFTFSAFGGIPSPINEAAPLDFPPPSNVPDAVWYTGWGPLRVSMTLPDDKGLLQGLPWQYYQPAPFEPVYGHAVDPGWQVVATPLTGPYWNPTGSGTPLVTDPRKVTEVPAAGGSGYYDYAHVDFASLPPGAYRIQVKLYTPDGSQLLTDSSPLTLVVFPGAPSPSQYGLWYESGTQLGAGSGLPSLSLQFNAKGIQTTVPGLPSSGTVLLERALFTGGPNGHGPVTVLGTASVQNGVAQFLTVTPEPPGIPWALRAVWIGNGQIPPEFSPWTGPAAVLSGGMGTIKLSASGPAMVGGVPVKLTGTVLGPGNQPATGYVGWARLTASSGTLVSTVMVQNGQFTAWYQPPVTASSGSNTVTLTAALAGSGEEFGGQPITPTTYLTLPLEMAPAAIQLTVPDPSVAAVADSVPVGGQLLGPDNQPDPYTGSVTVEGSNGVTVNGGPSATVTVTQGKFVVDLADKAKTDSSLGRLTLRFQVPELQKTLSASVPVLSAAANGSAHPSSSPAHLR